MKFAISNVCSSFQAQTIGTKVTEPEGLLAALVKAVEGHDHSNDRAEGQHFIPLPEAINYVSGGVGERTRDTTDYVLRVHREGVVPFLKRSHAIKPISLAVIVYTREAYLADCRNDLEAMEKDPNLSTSDMRDELARIEALSCTHVIVAVLASSHDNEPLTPWRLVGNLAGGNREALAWGLDEVRAKCKESFDYWAKYCVVAD